LNFTNRHCEDRSDEAIQLFLRLAMDCFAQKNWLCQCFRARNDG
jgi:hypothetical protein